MTTNVFPVPSSGGLVVPMSGAVTLQQTLTSSGAVTIPGTITQVYAVVLSGGGGGYSQGTGQACGGNGGVLSFGITTPATTVTIGTGGFYSGPSAGMGGVSTYGSISSQGPGGLDFDMNGVGYQWNYAGTLGGGAIGRGGQGQSSTNAGGIGYTGGGCSDTTKSGGTGGPAQQYAGATCGGGGYAGAAVTTTGGLGGGGGGGGSTNRGGAGIVYLYY